MSRLHAPVSLVVWLLQLAESTRGTSGLVLRESPLPLVVVIKPLGSLFGRGAQPVALHLKILLLQLHVCLHHRPLLLGLPGPVLLPPHVSASLRLLLYPERQARAICIRSSNRRD